MTDSQTDRSIPETGGETRACVRVSACEDRGRGCDKEEPSVGKEEEGRHEQNFCSKAYLKWKHDGKIRNFLSEQ